MWSLRLPRLLQRVLTLLFLASIALACTLPAKHASAHVADRPDLNGWFDQLASGKGLCCSFADGHPVTNVDWDSPTSCEAGKTDGDGMATLPVCSSHYRVYLDGEWIIVPDSALVTEPNKYGSPLVWTYKDILGNTQIRCFLPGAGG